MDIIKTQSPLTLGEKGVYPLTTADQVILADGTRLMKNGAIAADNASKIGGYSFDALKTYILDLAHPVGSYYWSSKNTDPSSLFGGTWEQIKDQFILAAGDNYNVGEAGGEAEHILIENELPTLKGTISSHTIEDSTRASQWYSVSGVFDADYFTGYITAPKAATADARSIKQIQFKAGGDQPHNNMPPYLVAYCWRRTA